MIPAIKELKTHLPDLMVMCDVCLCPYTDHGHCGVLTDQGEIDNDTSVVRLGEIALKYAQEGADMVAPSDCMDG